MSAHVIDRLGLLGDGIASGPVFVARALPGEHVEGLLEGNRIDAPRILTPSPDRVAPACGHYASCGGCALMHARDGFVADWKAEALRSALAARKLPAPIAGIATSPVNSRRRAVLSGRRTKKGAIVGFHARRSDTLTGIEACRVLVPPILEALPVFEAITVAGAARRAELAIQVIHGPSGLDVAVRGGKPLDLALRTRLVAIAAHPSLARLSWNGEPFVQARLPAIPMGRAHVVPPPGGFLQATLAGEAALVARIREATRGAARAVDLFAGCGTFSLPLAERCAIHAVESDAAALQAAEDGWRGASGLKPLTTEARDLFRRPLVAQELDHFDAAIIDPPRAGAEAQMRQIAASRLSRVVAVSCNPVTFARDAAILAGGGFRLDRIDVVDQFRWSPHVELVAVLSR